MSGDAGTPSDRRLATRQWRYGSSVRLEDPDGVDRPPPLPGNQQGDSWRRALRHLPRPLYPRRTPGGRPTIHHLLRLHSCHRQNQDRHPRPRTALRGRGLRGLLSDPSQRQRGATVRWLPAHSTFADNEKSDEFAKAAASKNAPRIEIPTNTAGRPVFRTWPESPPRPDHARQPRRSPATLVPDDDTAPQPGVGSGESSFAECARR